MIVIDIGLSPPASLDPTPSEHSLYNVRVLSASAMWNSMGLDPPRRARLVLGKFVTFCPRTTKRAAIYLDKT
jgi:hypothetical protein